jgi:hypothetical protein
MDKVPSSNGGVRTAQLNRQAAGPATMRMLHVTVLGLILCVSFATSCRAAQDPVWFWFEDCGSKRLSFEVLVDGKLVLKRAVRICRRGRWDKDEGEQKHLTVGFVTSRDISWDNYIEGLRTTAGARLELDMWQGAADPDALGIGIVVTSPARIYTHTYHFAHPNRLVMSKIAPGIVVRSFPLATGSAQGAPPPNKSFERMRER